VGTGTPKDRDQVNKRERGYGEGVSVYDTLLQSVTVQVYGRGKEDTRPLLCCSQVQYRHMFTKGGPASLMINCLRDPDGIPPRPSMDSHNGNYLLMLRWLWKLRVSHTLGCCLLLIDKVRTKEKTYI
jgi:hypothetical protein